MSPTGTMRETYPLFPWRPAILSPTESLRFLATYNLRQLNDSGGSSSPSWILFFSWRNSSSIPVSLSK